ncbi:phage tail tip fiber protein [Enterobacter hormaechei]
MSEPKSIPHVTTTPKPFGVNVEWKWPDLSFWGSWLELQYLLADGRLLKEVINWPVTEFMISGLKAGERLQVRLRPIAADGSARDWRTSDWIEAVSSADAGEMIEALMEEIRNSRTLNDLNGGWFIAKSGQVFINNAAIGDVILSANYRVKMGVDCGEKQYTSGMVIGAEGEQCKVEFKADRFKVHESASAIIENAKVTNIKTKTVLCDEMKQAVIDAVRESDLFTAIQVNIDAQTASVAGMQQAMHDAVNDAIRNALKPGGLLYSR